LHFIPYLISFHGSLRSSQNWGKAEIGAILATLHNDDERVRPLLPSIDELRGLLKRHTQKCSLVTENFVELVVLVLTPAQQEQFQRARDVAQQQEILRQQQQQAQEQERQRQQQIAVAQQQAAAAQQMRQVRLDKERRDELTTQSQAAKIACAYPDAPPP
jgi:hypothetical protein